MNWKKWTRWIVQLSLAIILGGVAILPAQASTDGECAECHREVVDRGMRKRYVHMPFMKKQCSPCHVAGQAVEPSTSNELTELDESLPQKIRWFKESYGTSRLHWVLLPAGRVDGTLILRAWDAESRPPLRKLELPPLEQLPVMADDHQPPFISEIEVRDVRRGISTTATIAWSTNEFADSQVAYGIEAMGSKKVERKLSLEHKVILTGLDADATYRFQVTSSDLFGNSSASKVLTFSTNSSFMLPESRHEESGGVSADVEFSYELFKQEGNYLVIFEADRPVSIAIGIPVEEKATVAQEIPQMSAANTSHAVLKSELETSIRACDSCHAYLKESYSHPVNVLPKAGMVVPTEYPLLPDGRMSCMTCHATHGGDYEYRLIKSGKKELCLGCHTDY